MLKKIFIISSVLLLISTVFFGIYIVAFKNESSSNNKKNVKEEKKSEIEELMSKKLINITSEPVISATVGPQGDTIRYYSKIDGRAWMMTIRGTNKEIISNETRGVLKSAKWSNKGDATILTYENGEIFVVHHATGENNKLRDGMDDVEWVNANNKILYKYYDKNTNERTLNIANADGTNWNKIIDLPFRYTSFAQIPSSIFAAFWPTGDVTTTTELVKVNTIGTGAPKKIFEGKQGVEYKFSPNGKKILFSFSYEEGKKVMLGIMDIDGSNYNEFMIPTSVKKAVWSEDNNFIYYAQPNNIPDNIIWPNDYNENKFTTNDTFYKMDIESGKKERIIELDEIDENVDAENLFLSPSEDKLFFINRINGLLYRINL